MLDIEQIIQNEKCFQNILEHIQLYPPNVSKSSGKLKLCSEDKLNQDFMFPIKIEINTNISSTFPQISLGTEYQ